MAAVKYWFRTAIEWSLWATLALAAGVHAGAGEPAAADADAFAADRSALAERLQGTAVFSADFTQSVLGVRGELLERSEGYVRLQRPRFKWVVDEPYPQVLVTDGDALKLYDPDLEQLTVRPLEEALEDTPVSLLTQDAVAIGQSFDVMQIKDAEGESFVIAPTAEDSLYREILLHFDGSGLTGLDILDHLGQRTEIRFQADAGVTEIDPGEFTLEVPPGTDIIGG